MDKAVLMALVITITCCYSNKGQVVFPSGERDLLQFLNSDDWKLHQICVDGNCKETSSEDDYPFGIDTQNPAPSYCSDEKGDFYTIGKYYWQTDPETFQKSVATCSDPDYFTIVEYGRDGKDVNIRLCTPDGYYSGLLKVIDAVTIQIIAERPEYEGKEVIQVYKKN